MAAVGRRWRREESIAFTQNINIILQVKFQKAFSLLQTSKKMVKFSNIIASLNFCRISCPNRRLRRCMVVASSTVGGIVVEEERRKEKELRVPNAEIFSLHQRWEERTSYTRFFFLSPLRRILLWQSEVGGAFFVTPPPPPSSFYSVCLLVAALCTGGGGRG